MDVNNISLDHATAANSVVLPEITTETGTTPKQLYRCTDNKIFEPKLIVAVNQDSSTIQVVKLIDADLTDAGDEDNNKAETKPIFAFTVGPEDMTVLDENLLKGLRVRYGLCGYNSTPQTAGSGVLVYVAGEEK